MRCVACPFIVRAVNQPTAPTEHHYLVDIADGEVPRGAAIRVYTVLWALQSDPFASSPTVRASIFQLSATTKLTVRAIYLGIQSLREVGLISMTESPSKGKGTPASYLLRRPAVSGVTRTMAEPFTREETVDVGLTGGPV